MIKNRFNKTIILPTTISVSVIAASVRSVLFLTSVWLRSCSEFFFYVRKWLSATLKPGELSVIY